MPGFDPSQQSATGIAPKPIANGLIDFLKNGNGNGRNGVGGFFDVIGQATQSPLFGLGVGLLSGSPQQGFQNARSLANDADFRLKSGELRERIVNAVRSGKLAQMSPEQAADFLLQ